MNKLHMAKIPFFFMLILILCGLMATEAVSDNDLWWHLKTGEFVIQQGEIPTHDVFSFYGIENNLSWTAHEWLSDVVLYLFYNFFGFQGLIFFPIILLALTMIVLYRFKKDIATEQLGLFFTWFFISGFILAMLSSTRPHMFSFLLFALTIYVAHLFLQGKNKVIYLLPIISLLWVNLHGGSSALLFVAYAFLIVGNFFNFKFQRIESSRLTNIQWKHLGISFLLSLLAGCANPYGYHMLLYPVINMLDSTMLTSIVEWHSPDFHQPEGLVIFITIAVAMAIVLISNKKISFYHLLILFAFLFLSLRSIRQISYFVIAVTPLIVLCLPYLKFKLEKSLMYSFMMLIVIGIFTVHLFPYIQKPTDEREYPKEALTALRELKPNHLFNDYNWGGYLIWNVHDDDIYPFIDGRADIFSKYTMEDYNTIIRLNPDWDKAFEKYNFDAALIPRQHLLVEQLMNKYGWVIKYEDDTTILLQNKKED